MGNFNYVTMGTGVLKWDGVDVGYLKGDVTYRYNYEIEDFKTGVPLMLRGSVTKEVVAELSCGLAELSCENVAMILGGLSIATTAATPVDETMELYTFASYPYSPGMEAFKIPGGDLARVTITPASVVIKDVTEVTTYTEFDDYIVDYDTGWVFLNPNGAILSGATIKCTNEYTPTASRQVNLGVQFSLGQKSLEFIHVSPVTGKTRKVFMWLASSNGQVELPFAESAFNVINVTFKAIYDESHPTNPLGYYYEET